MVRVPTDIKARQQITIDGHSYAANARIKVTDLQFLGKTNALSAYLSKGVLYPVWTDHAHDVPGGHPQPVSLPASVLKAILSAEEVQDAPTIDSITVTDGNASVSLAITHTNGSGTMTNVEYSLDDGVTWVACDPAVTSSPVAISGLTNGTVYDVVLRGVSSFGQGEPTAAVTVAPFTTPTAPTDLVATPGASSASIAFTAGDGRGRAITNYEYKVDAGAWTALSPADITSPVVITGLTPETPVDIRLRAVNEAGTSAQSASVNVTPTA